MSKLSRAESSRRNGAKSRGPVTTQGKAISSKNAITHGMFARDACLATENRDEFDNFRGIYLRHLQPIGEFELQLVEQIAGLGWRLRRAESIETALLDLEVDLNADEVQRAFHSIDRQGMWALGYKTLSDHSTSFANLDKYQVRIARLYFRHLQQLKEVQAARTAGPPALPLPLTGIPPEKKNSGNELEIPAPESPEVAAA